MKNKKQFSTSELLGWAGENFDAGVVECVNFVAMQNLKAAEYKLVQDDEDHSHDDSQDSPLCRSQDVSSQTGSEHVSEQDSLQGPSHWGLNLRGYLHFTSPIRRYADVVVHRLLATMLLREGGGLSDIAAGRTDDGAGPSSSSSASAAPLLTDAELEELSQICERCNSQKRKADDAGVDSQLWYFGEFLRREQKDGVRLRAVVQKLKTRPRSCLMSAGNDGTGDEGDAVRDEETEAGSPKGIEEEVLTPGLGQDITRDEDAGVVKGIPKKPQFRASAEFFLPQLRQTKGATAGSAGVSEDFFRSLRLGQELEVLAVPSSNSLAGESKRATKALWTIRMLSGQDEEGFGPSSS